MNIEQQPPNPAWPEAKIMIGGHPHRGVFDMRALKEFEKRTGKNGWNALEVWANLNMGETLLTIEIMIAANHPEMTAAHIERRITPIEMKDARIAIQRAWLAAFNPEALEKKTDGDPLPPQAADQPTATDQPQPAAIN